MKQGMMQPILGSAAHGPFSGARGPASFFQSPRALIDGTFETRRLEGAAPPPRESPIPCMAQRQRHKSADVCRSALWRRRRALQDAGAGKERSAPTQPAASPRAYTASGIRQSAGKPAQAAPPYANGFVASCAGEADTTGVAAQNNPKQPRIVWPHNHRLVPPRKRRV